MASHKLRHMIRQELHLDSLHDEKQDSTKSEFLYDMTYTPFVRYSINTSSSDKISHNSSPRSPKNKTNSHSHCIAIGGSDLGQTRFIEIVFKENKRNRINFHNATSNTKHTFNDMTILRDGTGRIDYKHLAKQRKKIQKRRQKILANKTQETQIALQEYNGYWEYQGIKLKNANIKRIKLKTARYSHSYITQNNKYIIVFRNDVGYNIFDISQDKWLKIEGNCKTVIGHYITDYHSRSIFINDELLIFSFKNNIFIFRLSFNNIGLTVVKLVAKYYSNKMTNYNHHGFCCVEWNIRENVILDEKDVKTWTLYDLKLLLFGGDSIPFGKSIVQLNISLEIPFVNSNQLRNDHIAFGDKECNIKVIERHIIKDDMKYSDNGSKYLYNGSLKHAKLCNFGYECAKNDNNESVVIIIGGNKIYNTGLILYNVNQQEISINLAVL